MLHSQFIGILIGLGATLVVSALVLGGALYFFYKIWTAGVHD